MIYGQWYNLIDLRQKFIWFEQIFVWSKDILFESNFVSFKQNISLNQRKCFKQIIFFIQSNLFSECIIPQSIHYKKKDLIESKKIICLNDFLWFTEMLCSNEIKFVWFKQNIFEPNKYLFE